MSTVLQSKFYDDLDTFFKARGLQRRPDGDWWEDSYDFGVWWRTPNGRVYRLTWIGDAVARADSTAPGELYLVRLSGPHVSKPLPETVMVSAGDDTGDVEFLGVVPPAMVSEPAEVLLGRQQGDPARNVEAILDGWAEECGKTTSVDWVRERMARAIADGRAIAP